MAEPIFEFQQISKSFFGVKAVQDVSLKLVKGQILGLIGENGAGKSTLMNILGGIIPADSGKMLLKGKCYAPENPAAATSVGIAFIHQELNLFTNLSIADNIFIDGFPKFKGLPLIHRRAVRETTRSLLDAVNLKLSPEVLIERLSPGERQLVEIAKALRIKAGIVIFDEPTTSLTARETERLFELINHLREQGKAIIYISHVLNDVLRLADNIAVMQDGKLMAEGPRAEFSINRMISLMVGRELDRLYPARTQSPDSEVLLEVCHLNQPGIIKDINFRLRKKEILGLFGLMGSGRSELARIIFGMDAVTSGEIRVNQNTLCRPAPGRALHQKLAFVTENRREEGLLMDASIQDNLALVALPRFTKSPFPGTINQTELQHAIDSIADTLRIKCDSLAGQSAQNLSGGNQQKVVIGKWLLAEPLVFIMDEPTRGIDVGAKYDVYCIINDLARKGSGVLFISSELEELMGICDRILVMSNGEIMGEFLRKDFDEEQILRAAFREV